MERKNEIDNGTLYKEETEWKRPEPNGITEENIQQDFLWTEVHEVKHQKYDLDTEPDKKNTQTNQAIQQIQFAQKKHTTREKFSGQNKQTRRHRKISGKNFFK